MNRITVKAHQSVQQGEAIASLVQTQKRQLQSSIQQVEVELANTVIRSPVVGTIQQLNLRNIDQLVRPGDTILLLSS